jgi:2-hydroxy-4-carboxymuconate semialdehyde hemiacetal dehydrogenase
MAGAGIAIIGCGAVAAVHASRLSRAGVPIASVCGSEIGKAQTFAAAHKIDRAVSDLDSALEGVDAAIIASPSSLHYQQALRALEQRVHVLAELPACASAAEAEDLRQAAIRFNVILQCAHTSRYIEPYHRIGCWIRENRLGTVRQIHYFRCVLPSRRSWRDDALLHHASHPIDLLSEWFGEFEPTSCAGTMHGQSYTDVALTARLSDGAPVTIAISYSAKLPQTRMTVIGEEHTVIAEGFQSITSDDEALVWQGDSTAIYKQAIEEQDLAFLMHCQTGSGGIAWSETIKLTRYVDAFRRLHII